MQTNIYLKHFKKKSNYELEEILEKKSKYVPQAIQAASLLLEQRQISSIPNSNEIVVNDNIENVASESKAELHVPEKESLKTQEGTIVDDPSAPELYPKNLVLLVSFLISIIFGVILLAGNFHALGKKREIPILCLSGLIPILVSGVLFYYFENPLITLTVSAFGSVLLTEYFWNKYIGKSFKHRKKKLFFI